MNPFQIILTIACVVTALILVFRVGHNIGRGEYGIAAISSVIGVAALVFCAYLISIVPS